MANKTIYTLRQSGMEEESIPIDMLAQRDFIEKEVEFFGDCLLKQFKFLLIFFVVSVILFFIYY
jgi:hypothetical protein